MPRHPVNWPSNFTVTYVLEGITRPGYDAGTQPISALSLGPGGWVQRVNFVVFGTLTLLSAVGWYRGLSPGRGAIWFPLIQGINGHNRGPYGRFTAQRYATAKRLTYCLASTRGRR